MPEKGNHMDGEWEGVFHTLPQFTRISIVDEMYLVRNTYFKFFLA